jgi:hypothetical protein
MTRTVSEVRVVPWELFHPKFKWGVAVRYDDGAKEAYPIGDREAADAEVAVARLKRAPVKLRIV